jgi:hypothetical protein
MILSLFKSRSLKERDHLENQDIYRRVILKWIIEISGKNVDWIRLVPHGAWQHSNEPLGSIKG